MPSTSTAISLFEKCRYGQTFKVLTDSRRGGEQLANYIPKLPAYLKGHPNIIRFEWNVLDKPLQYEALEAWVRNKELGLF